MKRDNENKNQAVAVEAYEAPALTAMTFKAEKGYASSVGTGVSNYQYDSPGEDW